MNRVKQEHVSTPYSEHNTDDLLGSMQMCGHILFHRRENRHDFGHGQGKILRILSELPEMSQKELQDKLCIEAGSMSEIIKKMEEKHLLIRTKNKEDKRKIILSLTENGKKAAFDVKESRKCEVKKLFAALEEAERVELKRLLDKLLYDWNKIL